MPAGSRRVRESESESESEWQVGWSFKGKLNWFRVDG